MRFETRKYREDFAGLTHRVIDTEDGEVIDEAMTAEEAQEFADTLNSLWKYYRDHL